jgi:hypothetical protein
MTSIKDNRLKNVKGMRLNNERKENRKQVHATVYLLSLKDQLREEANREIKASTLKNRRKYLE